MDPQLKDCGMEHQLLALVLPFSIKIKYYIFSQYVSIYFSVQCFMLLLPVMLHYTLYIFPPHAVVQCPALDEMSNGLIDYSENSTDSFRFGAIASYSCQEGFAVVGNNRLTCSVNGTSTLGIWDSTPPVCSGRG